MYVEDDIRNFRSGTKKVSIAISGTPKAIKTGLYLQFFHSILFTEGQVSVTDTMRVGLQIPGSLVRSRPGRILGD